MVFYIQILHTIGYKVAYNFFHCLEGLVSCSDWVLCQTQLSWNYVCQNHFLCMVLSQGWLQKPMRAHDLEAAIKQSPLCFQASAALPCAVKNTTHSPVIACLTLEGGPVAGPAAPAAPVGAPQQFFRFLSQAWIAPWQQVPASSANQLLIKAGGRENRYGIICPCEFQFVLGLLCFTSSFFPLAASPIVLRLSTCYVAFCACRV